MICRLLVALALLGAPAIAVGEEAVQDIVGAPGHVIAGLSLREYRVDRARLHLRPIQEGRPGLVVTYEPGTPCLVFSGEASDYVVTLEEVVLYDRREGRKIRPDVASLEVRPAHLTITRFRPWAVRLESRAACVVNARVTGPRGEPVPGARVVATSVRRETPGPASREARTSQDGTAVLHGLARGRYRVWIADPGDLAQAVPSERRPTGAIHVDLTPGTPGEATFEIALGGVLDVLVDRRDTPGDERLRAALLRRDDSGVWRHPSRQAVPHQERLPARDGAGEVDRFRFVRLPGGEYRVRLTGGGRQSVTSDAVVVSGLVVTRTMAVGPPGLAVEVIYRGVIPETRRGVPIQLRRWDDPVAYDLDFGTFHRDTPRLTLSGLRRGRYVAIVRDRKLAVPVDLDGTRPPPIVLDPPGPSFLAGGSHRVSVSIPGRMKPVFVGLAPANGEPLRAGRWMRFSSGGLFEDVPDGRYSIVVLDGILGEALGFDGPATRTIEVRGDVEVEIRP